MQEEDVLAYVGATIKSVWTLETLLLLRRSGRAWSEADLVRELRGSTRTVEISVEALTNAGLAAVGESGEVRFAPLTPVLEQFAASLEELYRMKPVEVLGAVAASPNEKLHQFANAFRLKE
ncbi:MAG TPA: hypothetical protein VGH02_01970 [Rhizomicrobium sp.]